MQITLSAEALWNMLQSLSPDNKRWLGEKLIEAACEEEDVPGQMTVAEAKEWLAASEYRFEQGECVTEEEMDKFFETVRIHFFWHTSQDPDSLPQNIREE